MLPPKRFDVCRYEWMKADGYGKVCMDGKHFYSTRPENANKQVLVGIRAHTVDILTEGGQVVTTHRRAYGDNRTDISDYSTHAGCSNEKLRGVGKQRAAPRNTRCFKDLHGCAAERETEGLPANHE